MPVKKNYFRFLIGIFGTTLTLSILLLIFVPLIGQASLVPICAATGNCGVCDIVNVAVTIGKWLITGAGGLALLVIIWAAFGMVASAGNAEAIGAAKKQITGALIGMVITLVAFQLIMLVIFLIATPSNLNSGKNEKKAQDGAEAAQNFGSLKNFLGVPWWNICNEKELRLKKDINNTSNDNRTAVCSYWGDGTVCSTNRKKICIKGKCLNLEDKEDRDKIINPKTGKKLNFNNELTACGYLAAVDPQFKKYTCNKQNECDTSQSIEKGFCPGDKTIVCCVKKASNK